MWNPFKREKTITKSFDEIRRDAEISMYPTKQSHSDHELERNARAEAWDMFEQYKVGIEESNRLALAYPEVDFFKNMKGKCCTILVPRPRNSVILVYPGQTSKYDSQSLKELRNKYFQEFKVTLV